MKKLNFFMLLLMVGMIAVTACKKDEEDPDGPNLTITPDKTTAWQGDTITFTYSVSSNATLAKLSWSTTAPNIVPSDEVALSGNSVTNQEILIILPTTGVTAGSLTFTFVATDKDGLDFADTKNITITLAEPAPVNTPFATEITTGLFYHIQGSLHGAYNLDGDATVGAAGEGALKSMKNTDAAGVAFTGSWTSDAQNGTLYVKTTTIYADIYTNNVETLYNAGTANATVNNPAVGDVYIGKKGSNYYVIQITALDPEDNTCGCANKGKITFKYKK